MSQSPQPPWFLLPAQASSLELKKNWFDAYEAIKDFFPRLGDNYTVLGGLVAVDGGKWDAIAYTADVKARTNQYTPYNCLGWVMAKPANMASTTRYWDSIVLLSAELASRHLKQVPADQALVDVYTHEGKLCHVAKRESIHDTKWTSKLGPELPLIMHDRNALEGGSYGTITHHFGVSDTAADTIHALAANKLVASHEEASPGLVSAEDIETVHAHALLASSIKTASVRPTVKPTKPTTSGKVPTKPTTPAKPPTKPTTPVKPTTPTKPGTGPQTGNPIFGKYFEAWKKTWRTRTVMISSREDGFTLSSEYKQLIKLGPAILPQLVAALASAENTPAVVAYKALDKKSPVKGVSQQEDRVEILKLNSGRTKSIASKVKSFSAVRDRALSGLPQGVVGITNAFGLPTALGAAAQLLANPLFLDIVKEGGHAVVNILEDYAKTGAHGKAIWEEALKEIFRVEKENGNIPQEIQEFETWLATYTGETVPGADGTEVQPEEPAMEEVQEPVAGGLQ